MALKSFSWSQQAFLLASCVGCVAGSSSLCSAHSDCAGFDGECCPTEHGITLNCCGKGVVTVPVPTPTPPTPAPHRRTRPTDRAALLALWEANGKQGVMFGWGVGDPCNGEVDLHALANSQGFGPWKGVGCTPCGDAPEFDCVYQIYLHQKSLNGTIPESFRDMSELSWLFLSGNNMTGPLPTTIWSTLPKLSMLDLSYNEITGDLPLTSISACGKLRRILANDNHFDSISYSGGGFDKLAELNFVYNRNMSGAMPQAFGNLPELRFLYVHDTNLTGYVPQGPFRRAQQLVFSGNGHLCGPQNDACERDWTYCDIHGSFGECPKGTPKPKFGLDFGRGRRGAGFDISLGRRRKVEIGGWKGGRRKGGIHFGFGKQAVPTRTRTSDKDALVALWEANGKQGIMYGWGMGDPCAGEVDTHALANSQGFGPWKGVGCTPCSDEPALWCVQQIWLHQKSLNGTIPEGFKGMSELGWLFLSGNNMTGPLPTSIWQTLPKLTLLDISYNQITGDLPLASMSGNSHLLRILANDNHFDSITYAGGGFQSLVELNFMYNRNMTGQLPQGLGDMPALEFLYIHDTNLTGRLPVGAWPYIHHLIFSGNGHLCGQLPPVCFDPEVWCDLQDDLGTCSEATSLIASFSSDEMKERVEPDANRVLI